MGFIKNNASRATGAGEPEKTPDYADLLLRLASADVAARRWAARDLLVHAQASVALVAQLRREEDKAVREVILTSLTRLGDETAIAGLVECLRSENVELRNDAIEAMKALPDDVAPIMGALLHDDDADVRIMAVNVLESLRHPHVEQWLIDVIENDPVVNVCGTALDLLSEVGSVAAREAVKRLKQRFSAEPYIVFAADLALKRIGGQ